MNPVSVDGQTPEEELGQDHIEEEELPGFDATPSPEEEIEGGERILNKVIPTIIAQVAFAPSLDPGGGGKPLTTDELAAQYVAMTSQVLDLIEFHECLGAVGTLSKTARLIIGVTTLAGGVFLMRPRPAKETAATEKPAEENKQP